MTVQELFKQIDFEKVFLSYIRRYNIIESYDHRFEVYQEVKAYEKFREDLFDFIKIMQIAKVNKENDAILFVIDLNEVDFEDKNKKRFEVFAVERNELEEKTKRAFSFYGETNNNINRFTVSFSKIEKVAGYEVFEKSIEVYGKEAVAAAICKEMQMFDFGQDEEGIQSFYDSLEKSAKQVDEGKCVSADEVFKELREKIYKEIKDENELIYLKELDKFNEKVDEIKRKWISDKIKENGQKMIDFVKE